MAIHKWHTHSFYLISIIISIGLCTQKHNCITLIKVDTNNQMNSYLLCLGRNVRSQRPVHFVAIDYDVELDVSEAVDGVWQNWSKWGECSEPCGRGEQVRTRSCDNPRPKNGGRQCDGPSIERLPCSCDPKFDTAGEFIIHTCKKCPSIGWRYNRISLETNCLNYLD